MFLSICIARSPRGEVPCRSPDQFNLIQKILPGLFCIRTFYSVLDNSILYYEKFEKVGQIVLNFGIIVKI